MSKPPSGLGTTAARGVMWTGGGQILRQIIQVSGQLLLVRLLAPGDFGLLGMAMFFIGIGQLMADFGIGSAIVQSRAADDATLSSCFWLNLGVAGAMALLVCAGSPWIGHFYGRADLVPLLAVLSLNLLLSGMLVLPNALLYRDMRFGELAKAQVIGSLSGAVAAVALAQAGVGVWALVAQPLVGTSAMLLMVWRAVRWRPHMRFEWPSVAPLARFSAALLGANLASYGNRNLDSLLIGRVLGAVALGYYAMAIQLMLYPLQQISSVIVRVLFPTLAQIQHDPARLRGAYLKAVATIAFATFPLMGGLFVMTDDFVHVAFGASWMPMAPVLRVLSWVGMMQSVATTVGTIYLAVGKPHLALRVSLVATPLIAAGIGAGLPWGIAGVALGYATASGLLFYYTAVTAFRLIDLRLVDFHMVLARPAAAMAVMVVVLLALQQVLPASWAPAWRLTVQAGTGFCMYLTASLLLNGAQVRDLIAVVRALRAPAALH